MTIRQIANYNNAYRNLYVNNTQATKSMRQLSSGYRINSAADDAAGLAVSEKMRGQIGGLGKAYENAQAGASLVQTAEGALQSSNDILTRMRELAVQSSNGTYSAEDRAQLNKEFQSLKGELDRIAGATNYNGIDLLDGSLGGVQGAQGVADMGVGAIAADAAGTAGGDAKFTIAQENGVWSITAQFGDETITQQLTSGQTGVSFSFGGNTIGLTVDQSLLQEGTITGVGVTAGSAATDLSGALSAPAGSTLDLQVGVGGGADSRIGVSIADMSSHALGLTDVDILSASGANAALGAIDSAVNQVIDQRTSLGATQNRLEHTMSNLATSRENLVASESRIRDADMAKSIMEYMQRRLQTQASQAMLAQGMNMSQQLMMGLLMR